MVACLHNRVDFFYPDLDCLKLDNALKNDYEHNLIPMYSCTLVEMFMIYVTENASSANDCSLKSSVTRLPTSKTAT